MSHAAAIAGFLGAGSRTKGRVPVAAGVVWLAASCLLPGTAAAQETPAEPEAAMVPALILELNALQESDRGCRFTFVAENALGGELASAAFELVLFDKAGMVSRLTIVDFKDLPAGKTKVRQFDFAGMDCEDVGRVLINDSTDCSGEGIEPEACIRQLQAASRSEVLFGT